MFSSSLSRQSATLARTAAVAGLALAAFAFPAGTAAASAAPAGATAAESAVAAPEAATAGRLPAPAVDRICTYLDAVVAQLPLPAAPVQVCKLVNGWD